MLGKARIKDVENSDGVPGILVFFVVTAHREAVWQTLVDYPNFTKIFPELDSIKVLSEDQKGARVRSWISVAGMKFDYTLDRAYDLPFSKLSWHRHSGSFQVISGSWEILETMDPGKLLVVYESFVKIGFVVPVRLVRRSARNRAESMTKRLRKRVEGIAIDRHSHRGNAYPRFLLGNTPMPDGLQPAMPEPSAPMDESLRKILAFCGQNHFKKRVKP